MPTIQNEYNFRTALEDGFNLFLGPGFSKLAQDQRGKMLPLSQELALELVEVFSLPRSLATDLTQVVTILDASRSDTLKDYLTSRFTVSSFDERYQILDSLPIHTILSLNIDDLLHKVFDK